MDFAINARSEGRVLVPWEYRNYPNISRPELLGISPDIYIRVVSDL